MSKNAPGYGQVCGQGCVWMAGVWTEGMDDGVWTWSVHPSSLKPETVTEVSGIHPTGMHSS